MGCFGFFKSHWPDDRHGLHQQLYRRQRRDGLGLHIATDHVFRSHRFRSRQWRPQHGFFDDWRRKARRCQPRFFGFPFYTLTRVITPYLQIEGQYNRVNLTSILTTVIDIVGDVLVVFVMLGSMFEIGLATAIGYIIPFFVSAAYFMRKKNSHVFQLKIKGFSPKLCIKMFQLGAPMGITKGSKALGGLIINNMLTALTCRFSLRHTVFFLKSRCLYARRGTHRPIRSWRLPAFS